MQQFAQAFGFSPQPLDAKVDGLVQLLANIGNAGPAYRQRNGFGGRVRLHPDSDADYTADRCARPL